MSRCRDTIERDRDLYQAYLNVMRASDGSLLLPEILKRTVKQPAQRFYIGLRGAYSLVRALQRGDKMNVSQERKRMARDLLRLAEAEMQRNPERHLRSIMRDVIYRPAPEFYLKPSSAQVILHYEKKRERERFRKNPKRYLRSN